MSKEIKDPSDVSKLIKDREVKLIDFKFTDLPGSWQHFTTTLTEYSERGAGRAQVAPSIVKTAKRISARSARAAKSVSATSAHVHG